MTEASENLSGSTWDVEQLLNDALRPIEPPERLSARFEDTMAAITQAAAEELSDWAEELSESELRSLRDPRNWVRPVVAAGAGGVATRALVLLEIRRRGGRQAQGGPPGPSSGARPVAAGAFRPRAACPRSPAASVLSSRLFASALPVPPRSRA